MAITHIDESSLWVGGRHFWGFPDASVGEESACNTGDGGSVPGLGRSPGEENGYPLQYSCLENSMGREPGRLHSPWSHKESDMTERLNNSTLKASNT